MLRELKTRSNREKMSRHRRGRCWCVTGARTFATSPALRSDVLAMSEHPDGEPHHAHCAYILDTERFEKLCGADEVAVRVVAKILEEQGDTALASVLNHTASYCKDECCSLDGDDAADLFAQLVPQREEN